MEISGKIKRKKAVIITPDSLKSLCDIILKHCERIEFSAETYAKTSIAFDNLEELLNYDNYKPRRIISLEVAGYTKYSRLISVEIGDFNLSPIVNYGSTVRSNYLLSSVDAETIYKNDFETWYQKAKASYWLLGKFSLNGIVFVPSAFITFIRFCYGTKTEIDLSNPVILGLLVVVTAAIIGFMIVIKLLDAHLLGNLFPAVIFKWGEETKRNEKWEKFRSNLLWGIIIALLLGLVTNYLYDTLKGL